MDTKEKLLYKQFYNIENRLDIVANLISKISNEKEKLPESEKPTLGPSESEKLILDIKDHQKKIHKLLEVVDFEIALFERNF